MQRRSFLVSSAVGVGAVASTHLVVRAGNPTRTRVDFNKLSQQDQLLFAAAVGLMQSRESMNPGSWDFLAATHLKLPYNSNDAFKKAGGSAEVLKYINFDTLAKVPETLRSTWDTCIHHGRNPKIAGLMPGHFLSWHRLYLETFEGYLMAALAEVAAMTSKTPGLNALPYWDYYSSPVIPPLFRQATLPDGSTNPLYVSVRDIDYNSPNDPAQFVLNIDAMGATDLVTTPVSVGFSRFKGLDAGLEAHPHDYMHGTINGLMGSVPQAAWDPIFWLHHCNIDRLWAVWTTRHGGKAGPDVDTNWKNQGFTFVARGSANHVLWHADRSLTLAGYQYDSLAEPAPPPSSSSVQPSQQPAKPVHVPPLLEANPPQVALSSSELAQSLSKPAQVAVTSQGGRVVLPVEGAANQSKLGAVMKSTASAPTVIQVALNGVKVTEEGQRRSLWYDVFVTVAQAKDGPAVEPVQIGTINGFQLSLIPDPKVLRFDATAALQALLKGRDISSASVQVILMPALQRRNDGKLRAPSPSGSLLQINSMHLKTGADH